MTSPSSQPSDWQVWQTPVSATAYSSPLAADPVNWRTEAVVALFLATFSAAFGSVVGLIWPHVAPRIHLLDAINGSEAASKALLNDDMWLGLLGIAAGVVVVAVVTAFARDLASGPGGVIGLAVGGILGSIVAAQIGHLIQQPHLTSSLRTLFPGITHASTAQLLGYFGFRVRVKAVLLAWPIAALVLQLGVRLLRDTRAVDPTTPAGPPAA